MAAQTNKRRLPPRSRDQGIWGGHQEAIQHHKEKQKSDLAATPTRNLI